MMSRLSRHLPVRHPKLKLAQVVVLESTLVSASASVLLLHQRHRLRHRLAQIRMHKIQHLYLARKNYLVCRRNSSIFSVHHYLLRIDVSLFFSSYSTRDCCVLPRAPNQSTVKRMDTHPLDSSTRWTIPVTRAV